MLNRGGGLTRGLGRFSFMDRLNEMFTDYGLLTGMASKGGAPPSEVNPLLLRAFALTHAKEILGEEMRSSEADFAERYGAETLVGLQKMGLSHPEGRAYYRLQLEVEELKQNAGAGEREAVALPASATVGEERAATETYVPTRAEVPLAQSHGIIVDTKPLKDGGMIRLYEDEFFEVVTPEGKVVEPSQVSTSKMGWGNYWLSRGTQMYMWRAIFGGIGTAVGKVTPGLGNLISKGKEGAALVAETGQTAIEEMVPSIPTMVPPLQTPVAPPGSVEAVVFLQSEDGSIDRLSFGWTPDKDLFLRDGGWVKYK